MFLHRALPSSLCCSLLVSPVSCITLKGLIGGVPFALPILLQKHTVYYIVFTSPSTRGSPQILIFLIFAFARSLSTLHVLLIRTLHFIPVLLYNNSPRNGDLNDQKKTYNDHPKFNFPRRKTASAKVFIYIENTILSQYNFAHCFLDTGEELVRSARRLHTQRHILPNTSVAFLYISVGREKSWKI